MRQYVRNISPGNGALEFIDRRLADDNYRGNWSSQHNRFSMHKVTTILRILDKYAPDQSLMQIRTTDLSKRPENIPEERSFAMFCDEAKQAVGSGTQDAMRKNHFPDWHRMGLIARYGHDQQPTDPFLQQRVKYVAISDTGMRLIASDGIDEQYYIYSSGLDKLLGGFISILLALLRNKRFALKRVTIHEFMFFVSAIGTSTTFTIGFEKCVDLLRAYRSLSTVQVRSVVDILSDELKPKNYIGEKPAKRDYHNWKNKAEQIYDLLNQTVYFEVRDGILYLLKDRARSFSEKVKYFDRHKVNRRHGFELHHVVPLGWSESREQFKLFDSWKNMVYISGFEHAQITQNGNRNVVMKAYDEDLVLSDYRDNAVQLRSGETLLYDPMKQLILLEYNERLRRSVVTN
ncbi:MAG: hypothetical protein OXN88_12515 [Chloroflexota bacterium]|nr:hypothetical protein [Chloroflexota bacterium]